MAETEDGASRTEEATPHRLEEARRKGDVAKTPDLPQWASLAGAFGVLLVAGGYLMQQLVAQHELLDAGDVGHFQIVARQRVEQVAPREKPTLYDSVQ